MLEDLKEKIFLSYLCLASIFIFIFTLFSVDRVGTYGEAVSFGCNCFNFSGEVDYSKTLAYFEGRQIPIPKLAFDNENIDILGVANEERWIEVDLSDQKLYAWEGDKLFLQSLVSTGLPWWKTPAGEFRIWIKLRATRMEGGSGNNYYNLPNVPYVMYFENEDIPGWRGYGLHGTYWHSNFGTPRSHGCVNLPTEIAKELYFWTGPVLPEGKSMVSSDSLNPGTRIVIHD
ncbi:hypothetical protein A2686_01985 [Candidatus Woesebacteria bacterium RIFCSPHIGHO2_01_FULL_38_10]|nr:MAG: hypothetical protein A2686_01985 [Candidatus Woesebacteria bacterium RIFCSPHIGHO2_01_FULL_38_10]